MLDIDLTDRVVAAYGLQSYPYNIDLELNPLEREPDRDLAAWVDGWQAAAELEQFFRGRIEIEEPSLVVIAGGSGTGRSSLANFSVHKWAAARGLPSTKLIAAQWLVKNFDGEDQLLRWALSLRPRLSKKGVSISKQTSDLFGDLQAKPQIVAPVIQALLTSVVVDIGAGGALAGIVEGVSHASFLNVAAEFLPLVDILLVMTLDDTPGNVEELLKRPNPALDDHQARVLRLRELSGEEARTVVQHRWKKCAGDAADSPFSDQGLVEAFGDPPRPLGRVLSIAGALLVNKVLEVGASTQWQSMKQFTDAELGQKVSYLDAVLK